MTTTTTTRAGAAPAPSALMGSADAPAARSRRAIVALATLVAGLSAGFFFTYEASVTLGLAQVDDVTYVRTFQAINDTIRNPWFGLVFFGTIPLTAGAAVANWRAGGAVRALTVAALGLSVVVVGVTVLGSVPLNDELAAVVDVNPGAAAAARADFEDPWNRLDLARTGAATAGFACLVGTLWLGAPRTGRRTPSATAPVRPGTARTGGGR